MYKYILLVYYIYMLYIRVSADKLLSASCYTRRTKPNL